MKLFEDVISGDEMFSDAFPMCVGNTHSRRLSTHTVGYSKEVDDIVYEVDCAMVTIKEGDVDIGK
jgi:hypothetical protein